MRLSVKVQVLVKVAEIDAGKLIVFLVAALHDHCYTQQQAFQEIESRVDQTILDFGRLVLQEALRVIDEKESSAKIDKYGHNYPKFGDGVKKDVIGLADLLEQVKDAEKYQEEGFETTAERIIAVEIGTDNVVDGNNQVHDGHDQDDRAKDLTANKPVDKIS
jgi:hypothetical protein